MARLIQYIGKQQNRVDDVLKTKRVWRRPGDVIEVEDSEAPHYTQHAGEWRAITTEQHEAHLAERAVIEETVASTTSAWAQLSLDDLYGMRDQLAAEIKLREDAKSQAQGLNEVEAKAASSQPVDHPKDDPAAAGAAAERMKAIIEAINNLDRNDPADWAKGANEGPRVARVTEITGFKVSKAEITEALELMAAK